jgi:hypothetical protein
MKSGCKMGPWSMGSVTDDTCQEFWSMEDSEDWSLHEVLFLLFTLNSLL